ncbi:MAG: DNA alkylation repair protein [Elusimicrobia bacterium]|nr:DNA alkylation repair protein [Elusimicrobiota bacterium]
MSESIESKIREELLEFADESHADFLFGLFKTGSGDYAQGLRLLGVRVPDQRKIARKYYMDASKKDILGLLRDPYHDFRHAGLLILILKYEKATSDSDRNFLYNLYVENLDYVDNWNLVDTSAYKIVGEHLLKRDRTFLYQLAESGHLWRERVAIVATYRFIKDGDFSDSLKITEIFLSHPHDLIHKACGWMLREVGKKDFNVEYDFLMKYYNRMPRVMLRYAIEKFPPALREDFIKGRVKVDF